MFYFHFGRLCFTRALVVRGISRHVVVRQGRSPRSAKTSLHSERVQVNACSLSKLVIRLENDPI